MSKRTRLFVVIASTTLAAGVGTAAVASYVGFANLRLLSPLVADDLRYVPAAAQLLAYADVRRLVDSELRQTLHPDLTSSRGGRMAEELGLDLTQDVDSVLVALVPPPAVPSDAEPAVAVRRAGLPLLLARGRFDPARIEATVRNNGGVPDEKDGIRIVTNDEIGVAFLATGFIAVGQRSVVLQALDVHAGRAEAIRQREPMMRLMGQVDGGTTWVVANVDEMQGGNAVPLPVIGQLPALSWVAASGEVSEGLEARVLAEGRDDRAAADLQEVLRGMIALARLQSGASADVISWLDSVQLTNVGRTVSLSFSLPAAFFERLRSNPTLMPNAPSAPAGSAAPGASRRRALPPAA